MESRVVQTVLEGRMGMPGFPRFKMTFRGRDAGAAQLLVALLRLRTAVGPATLVERDQGILMVN